MVGTGQKGADHSKCNRRVGPRIASFGPQIARAWKSWPEMAVEVNGRRTDKRDPLTREGRRWSPTT